MLKNPDLLFSLFPFFPFFFYFLYLLCNAQREKIEKVLGNLALLANTTEHEKKKSYFILTVDQKRTRLLNSLTSVRKSQRNENENQRKIFDVFFFFEKMFETLFHSQVSVKTFLLFLAYLKEQLQPNKQI